MRKNVATILATGAVLAYSPKEGTTGFWGLRDVPVRPDVKLTCDIDCDGSCGDICPVIAGAKERLRQFGLALESCKSNSLEIVNPEVFYWEKLGTSKPDFSILNSGDLFDLPEGFEFKEEEMCSYDRVKCGVNCYECPFDSAKVLRLVKTETKGVTIENVGENGIIIEGNNRINILAPGGKCVLQRPEPEESQAEEFTDEEYAEGFADGQEFIKSSLREQIEKEMISIGVSGHYADGRTWAFKRTLELLDSLTPKK